MSKGKTAAERKYFKSQAQGAEMLTKLREDAKAGNLDAAAAVTGLVLVSERLSEIKDHRNSLDALKLLLVQRSATGALHTLDVLITQLADLSLLVEAECNAQIMAAIEFIEVGLRALDETPRGPRKLSEPESPL